LLFWTGSYRFTAPSPQANGRCLFVRTCPVRSTQLLPTTTRGFVFAGNRVHDETCDPRLSIYDTNFYEAFWWGHASLPLPARGQAAVGSLALRFTDSKQPKWEGTRFIHRYLYSAQEAVMSTLNLPCAKEQSLSQTTTVFEPYVWRFRVSTKSATNPSNPRSAATPAACPSLSTLRCRQRCFRRARYLFALLRTSAIHKQRRGCLLSSPLR